MPEFTYRHQTPWFQSSTEVGNFIFKTDRYQADLSGVAELGKNSSLLAGLHYYHDMARALDNSSGGNAAAVYYKNQSDRISYDDLGGFAQYDLDTPWVNLSAGGRYEYHDAVGGSFVPRFALTKAWDKFHLKALYSQASRIPAINVVNTSIGGRLESEQTVNYELEAGYQFTDALSWAGNIYFMEVNRPIIFAAAAVGGTASEGYYNGSRLSSAGLESELRWNRPKYSTAVSYSFYRAVDNNIDYVRGDEGRFLAAPAHKITASATWHITPSLDWNVNAFWLGERLAYAYPAPGVTALPDEFVLNTFLNYNFKHFSVGIGAANLLDENRFAPQPYAGGSGPMPLKGREIFASLKFKF